VENAKSSASILATYSPFANSKPLLDAKTTPCFFSELKINRLSFLTHLVAISKLLSEELLSIKIASKLEKLCSTILLIALSIVFSALKNGSIIDTLGLMIFLLSYSIIKIVLQSTNKKLSCFRNLMK
jgi:hypothetical protein